VTTIAAIVIALAAAVAARAMRQSTVYVQASALHELLGSASSVRTAEGYPTNLIPALRMAEMLPAEFTDPGGDYVIHAWNGAVRLTSSGSNDIALAVEALPSNACTALARSLSSTERYVVEAGGQHIPSGNGEAAAAACSGGTTILRLTINS